VWNIPFFFYISVYEMCSSQRPFFPLFLSYPSSTFTCLSPDGCPSDENFSAPRCGNFFLLLFFLPRQGHRCLRPTFLFPPAPAPTRSSRAKNSIGIFAPGGAKSKSFFNLLFDRHAPIHIEGAVFSATVRRFLILRIPCRVAVDFKPSPVSPGQLLSSCNLSPRYL